MTALSQIWGFLRKLHKVTTLSPNRRLAEKPTQGDDPIAGFTPPPFLRRRGAHDLTTTTRPRGKPQLN
jgi:hypothetical protein